MFDDADFECLRPDRTARFTIDELHIPRSNPKPLTLFVRHAGESNDQWMRGIANSALKAMSEVERELYFDQLTARCVIIGWEDMLDKDGNALQYTAEAGADLLGRLRAVKRAGIVNRLSLFASNAANFTKHAIDPGELGKG